MARPEGPLVVCVINLKGGVGKSTIAALLARRAYSRRNKDVLAIDIDPQANLSQALMRSQYTTFLKNKNPSIVEVFAGYRPPAASRRGASGLAAADVAFTVLGDEERSLQLIPSRFDFSDNLTQSVRPATQSEGGLRCLHVGSHSRAVKNPPGGGFWGGG